jgi:hypothetical protein
MGKPLRTERSQGAHAIRVRESTAKRYDAGLCKSCPAKRDSDHQQCAACRLAIKIKRIKLKEAKARSKPCA